MPTTLAMSFRFHACRQQALVALCTAVPRAPSADVRLRYPNRPAVNSVGAIEERGAVRLCRRTSVCATAVARSTVSDALRRVVGNERKRLGVWWRNAYRNMVIGNVYSAPR